MTIISHDTINLGLIVKGGSRYYEYERIPEFYVSKVRGYIRRGFEGKAWLTLRQFKLVTR